MSLQARSGPRGDGLGLKTRHFQQTSLVISLSRDFLKNPSNPSYPSPRRLGDWTPPAFIPPESEVLAVTTTSPLRKQLKMTADECDACLGAATNHTIVIKARTLRCRAELADAGQERRGIAAAGMPMPPCRVISQTPGERAPAGVREESPVVSALAFHPAADTFPLLDQERLAALAEDIKANGLLHPIIVDHEGRILDGRNRYLACQMAGIEPKIARANGADPYRFVWSQNAERRDLEPGQRVLIWHRLARLSDEWQAEQTRRREEANRKRAEAVSQVAQQRERQADGTFGPGRLSADKTPGTSKPAPTHAHVEAATATGASPATAARALALKNSAPDLAQEVIDGHLSLPAATREAKKRTVVAALNDTAAREVKAAAGLYDVLVIDPPWPAAKIERDQRPNQVGLDYPIMTEDEIAALAIPAAKDCHVWLWTTQRFLPVAFRLLEGWGLKYVCTFVWHKPGGFQPVGLPQYNCEFALYARKGSPAFLDTKAMPVCFEAPRKGHSEKPEVFYDMVRRTTGGRRLDMFNRRAIEGFDGWGNEAPHG